MRGATEDRSERVADELWERVRTMAARAAKLEEADALGELDEEGRGRLAALRLRCSRATERARLADDIADRFADVRSHRATVARTAFSTGEPRHR